MNTNLTQERKASKKRRPRRRSRGSHNGAEHSQFWMSDFEKKETSGTANLIRIAKYRRAIADFVTIITGKNIPVQFPEKHQSYAAVSKSGDVTITIGAKISKREFDSATGLALHESHHITQTDMDYFNYREIPTKLTPKQWLMFEQLLTKAAPKLGISDISDVDSRLSFWKNFVVLLENWIEDRRIDEIAYKKAPGYRAYYIAMYNKYFRHKSVDNALQSTFATQKNIDSYIFRFMNIINENSDLDALPGLRDINKALDLNNIGRLKDTSNVYDLAIEVGNIIIDNIDKADKSSKSGDGSGKSDGNGGKDSENEASSGEGDSVKISLDESDNESSSEGNYWNPNNTENLQPPKPGQGGGEHDPSRDLKDFKANVKQLRKLLMKIEEQKNFNKGEVQKTALDIKSADQLRHIEEAGISLVTLNDVNTLSEAIVVKRLTSSVLASEWLRLGNRSVSHSSNTSEVHTWEGIDFCVNPSGLVGVDRGIILGKLLAKKLQLRSDDAITKYTRQKSGRFDKRLLSELGFGNNDIRSRLVVDKYNKAKIRISIDASGSMSIDKKWENTIMMLTAIIKASDIIRGIDIVVDFRITTTDHPVVVVVYDSRIDDFSRVRSLFPLFHPMTATPEGLCFESIISDIGIGTDEVDSYFLNISDGEPYFGFYSGRLAVNHTRDQVNKIKRRGVKVLSYFIDNDNTYRSNALLSDFKEMYGKSAKIIKPSDVNGIAKTINELFIEGHTISM